MADTVETDFPLFPLGLVALPEEPIPLHIFEERYKTMIGLCVAEDREFGIVWASEDETREVGCAVVVEKIVEQSEDGRLNILCRGTRPFRLLDRNDNLPYPAGSVEFLEDTPAAGDASATTTRTIYSDLYTQATERSISGEDLEQMNAYDMASTVDFGLEAKQTLLELRDESARLGFLERLFKAALKRVTMLGKAEALGGSNGRVRFGTDDEPHEASPPES
ncbi:MAG: LON peptidase substrate-binding domain-containing protein [Solirubrobacterales bacterium]|nr:LON peptidase substrate-binding domain-containing protein [Solirubrobacterales bacterium]